jgi:hypothetical protein
MISAIQGRFKFKLNYWYLGVYPIIIVFDIDYLIYLKIWFAKLIGRLYHFEQQKLWCNK